MSDESPAALEPPAEDRPLQFSLRFLLLLPVGLALFL